MESIISLNKSRKLLTPSRTSLLPCLETNVVDHVIIAILESDCAIKVCEEDIFAVCFRCWEIRGAIYGHHLFRVLLNEQIKLSLMGIKE
jgi:hypothetical protein